MAVKTAKKSGQFSLAVVQGVVASGQATPAQLKASSRWSEIDSDAQAWIDEQLKPVQSDPVSALLAGASVVPVAETAEQKIARLERENEQLRANSARREKKSKAISFVVSEPNSLGKAGKAGKHYKSVVMLDGEGIPFNCFILANTWQYLCNVILDEHERAKVAGLFAEAEAKNQAFAKRPDFKGWYGE